MSSSESEKIQANCRIIWGPGLYDIEIEHENFECWMIFVREDHGTYFGDPLLVTMPRDSLERAKSDLNGILNARVRDIQQRRNRLTARLKVAAR